MSSRADDDRMLLLIAGALATAAMVAGGFGIARLVKKKVLQGVLLLLGAAGMALLAIAIAAIVVLSWFAWH